ncbi:Uncharacterized protein K02A2.6 [Eumeta japonica]|uniref:Uncharacterized protein K02A2.6 n=1 Tax=Eumeta variegata TaxID=151549 RepID=A0A4C1UMS3_EUMVA|nr:Uncharacterized protein K02A2.6 [Eumeta japonica]
MELQLGQVLSQMMETMKGMQLQQAQLQQALQSSDKTVGGITLQPTGEVALQHKFCLRQQQEGESIANYVAGLKGIGEQYRELFTEEIGEINNFQATYRLKAGTSPIFLKPRPVPLALRDQVENEIDRLEKEGILEKVAYSQWGTPVVPVIKQNGKVRLCADYRATLNKNIEDDNYPIPRIEEIFSKLSGGKYFCTLDINSAYLHMPTNEDSRDADHQHLQGFLQS